jgi:hypothetical protein
MPLNAAAVLLLRCYRYIKRDRRALVFSLPACACVLCIFGPVCFACALRLSELAGGSGPRMPGGRIADRWAPRPRRAAPPIGSWQLVALALAEVRSAAADADAPSGVSLCPRAHMVFTPLPGSVPGNSAANSP